MIRTLLDLALLDVPDEPIEPSRGALERFDRLAFPASLLDATSIHHANHAWRGLFGDTAPGWAFGLAEHVLRARTVVHVPEVASRAGGRDTWLAVTLTPVRAHAERALLICAELADHERAHEVGVAVNALLWGGRLETPDVADHWNGHYRSYAGRDRDPSWRESIHPFDRPVLEHVLAEAKRDGASSEVFVRLLRHDRRYRWHRVSVGVASNNQRWFAIAIDCHEARVQEIERTELIERLRNARDEAERAHRLKDHVLAAVSHELRTPVTTMMLWERVLRDPNADAAARAQALDAFRQSIALQSRIVADLLDMSRAFSGKLHVDLRTIDLGRLVREAVDAALLAAQGKRITLTHDAAGFNADISGDATRLRQVLDNLLSNAIKFTEPGGHVMVSVKRTGGFVFVCVEDTGRGIAPELLERIFEPFSQGEDALTRREGGLGLGLAIARQIVELHNGSLNAQSDGPGRGARLTLMLPSASHRRAPSPPVGVTSPFALNGVRVLVVDDDPRVRDALTLLLDRAAAHVECANGAASAREAVARREPHILLCDIGMPDEDGYELIRTLRSAGHAFPAIALTAFASEAHARRALESGFDLHIAKPVDIDRLVASIQQLVGVRRAPNG